MLDGKPRMWITVRGRMLLWVRFPGRSDPNGGTGALRASRLAAVEPHREAQAAYVAEVDRRMRGTVWVSGGCRSWYLDATGRNSTLWPDTTYRFRQRVARFRPEEYQGVPARESSPAAVGA